MSGIMRNEISDILLSICIPTYNRAEYLVENLEVLIPQIEDSKYGVELIISDNGSTLENFNKIKEYVNEKKININLYHHEKNIGGRANFAYAVSMAKGMYVYLLGDDDILSPNLLEIICPTLNTHKYALIHFNYFVANERLQNPSLQSKYFDLCIKEMTPHEFLCNNDYDPSFMSSIIFLKECWDTGLEKVRDEYYGYEWMAAICWGVLLQEKKCMYYYFPLCLQRNPPRIWAKDTPIFKYIGIGQLFKDLDQISPGLLIPKIEYIDKIYYHKFFVDITKDPEYYRPYEKLFAEVLKDKRKLHFCFIFPFSRLLHKYFFIKMKIISLYSAGVRFFIR